MQKNLNQIEQLKKSINPNHSAMIVDSAVEENTKIHTKIGPKPKNHPKIPQKNPNRKTNE